MRKIKKINGYLIVRFNFREIEKWKGSGLGMYGVIDAEYYTGSLVHDRGVMKFDTAMTIEEAVDQARSLESEMDITDDETKIIMVKEEGAIVTEIQVDPERLYSDMEDSLKKSRESGEIPDLDLVTAAYFKGGFVTALVSLGIIEEGDERFDIQMYPQQREEDGVFHNITGNMIEMEKICRIGRLMERETVQNDCTIYKNIYQQCQHLDQQADHVTGYARAVLMNELYRSYEELRRMYYVNDSVRQFRRGRPGGLRRGPFTEPIDY